MAVAVLMAGVILGNTIASAFKGKGAKEAIIKHMSVINLMGFTPKV